MKKCYPLLLSLTLLFAACSKDSMPESSSSAKQILSFTFRSSDNPQITANSESFIIGNNIFVTLPPESDLSSLKASFELSSKAKLLIASAPQVSGNTANNYGNVLKCTVQAQDNSSVNYYVNVRCGIWQIDRLVYQFMQKFDIPGISVSVAYDEDLVYTQGYGYADQAAYKRVESNTLFRLASVSKSFTSIAILQLMNEAKLSLSDRPFAEGGVLTAEFGAQSGNSAQITIQMLLEHSSGWASDPMFSSVSSGMDTHEIIAHTLSSVGFANTPGKTHVYSNIGFCVLGRIVETVSGLGFEDFLRTKLFPEAGIKDIWVGGTLAQRRSNESIYYSQGSANGYANDMVRLRAAGALIASTPELMKWLTHIDGGIKVPDIISPQTRQLMLTPSTTTNRYALGWRVNHSMFPGAAYHGGNLAGTGSIWVMGSYNTHAAVLCNSRSYITGFDDELYVLIQEILQHGNWPKVNLF